jgi:hypothetical protein
MPASAWATTINVPAGGPGSTDDVTGNALNCNPGGSPSCPNLRDAVAYANAGDAGTNPRSNSPWAASF